MHLLHCKWVLDAFLLIVYDILKIAQINVCFNTALLSEFPIHAMFHLSCYVFIISIDVVAKTQRPLGQFGYIIGSMCYLLNIDIKVMTHSHDNVCKH